MIKSSSVALIFALGLLSTITAISTTPASGFVAKDSSIKFALNIPETDGDYDLYFTMSGLAKSSWIAVGMGSEEMKNSLMFMAYTDSTGKNVTLSPRLSYDHVEPSFANLTIIVLPGTGISNGVMTVNAMCKNCRSWKGSDVDPTNTEANFIWGVGPDGSIDSNSDNTAIKRHCKYGVFSMDLTKAIGVAGVPAALTASTSGTIETELTTDSDFSPALHAAIMIFVFVGLMPFGIMVLRILNSPKWHALNQTLSAVGAIFGAGLGIYIGTMYNRTKRFNSAHQIFGALIVVAMITQWVLGFQHHRIYKRTQATTRLGPIHLWLGRLIIPCGIADGFLGFPLALNAKYNWALVALAIIVLIIMGPLLFWKWRRNRGNNRTALETNSDNESSNRTPYWNLSNVSAQQSDIHLGRMDYGPPSAQQSNTHIERLQYGPPSYNNLKYERPVEGRQMV